MFNQQACVEQFQNHLNNLNLGNRSISSKLNMQPVFFLDFLNCTVQPRCVCVSVPLHLCMLPYSISTNLPWLTLARVCPSRPSTPCWPLPSPHCWGQDKKSAILDPSQWTTQNLKGYRVRSRWMSFIWWSHRRWAWLEQRVKDRPNR